MDINFIRSVRASVIKENLHESETQGTLVNT